MALPRNHCCNENATMRSACIVEVQVTVNNIEKLSVEQKCFMAKLRYVAGDNKTYLGLHVMSDIFVRFKKKIRYLDRSSQSF